MQHPLLLLLLLLLLLPLSPSRLPLVGAEPLAHQTQLQLLSAPVHRRPPRWALAVSSSMRERI